MRPMTGPARSPATDRDLASELIETHFLVPGLETMPWLAGAFARL
jgi:hypothetical protein